MMIKDLGAGVVRVWEGLRPITRKMLVGAMDAGSSNQPNNSAQKFSYDAHADWELSRLLSALDEQSRTSAARKNPGIERAIKQHDYNKLDKLADRLAERFSAGEIAEIVRQTEVPQIRAIAYETLATLPVPMILPLLNDPLYAEIAANALEQKAYEYDSDEARDLLDQFDSDLEARSE